MKNLLVFLFIFFAIFFSAQSFEINDKPIINFLLKNKKIDTHSYIIFNLKMDYLILGRNERAEFVQILLQKKSDTGFNIIKEEKIKSEKEKKIMMCLLSDNIIFKNVLNSDDYQSYIFLLKHIHEDSKTYMIPHTGYNGNDIQKIVYPLKLKYMKYLYLSYNRMKN